MTTTVTSTHSTTSSPTSHSPTGLRSAYRCTACGHLPTDAPRTGGALRHCEVCGSWVATTATAVGRDLDLPLRSPVPA